MAIENAERDRSDIILMDIRLKGEMDGIEAADHIRSRFNIPIIFLTAYSDNDNIERAKLTLPFGYLLKPFQDRELRVTIEMSFYATEVDTKRKRAEEAQRESEEKYRTILENIEEGYYEVDIAGNFTFFNDAMCKIRGESRDALMGMNNREYMTEETAEVVYKAYNEVYNTGKPAKNLAWETIRKDGTKRHVETSVSLIKDSEGHPIGFRGVVRDVTERKLAEEKKLDWKPSSNKPRRWNPLAH